MKNKILITGASGFIGSFLVEEALKKGFEVYAAIRSTSSKQFLQDKRIHFVELDFSSEKLLIQELTAFKLTEGDPDYVIHNAGITQAKKKEDFFTVNCTNTKNLVHALHACGIKLKKFVLISSLAAYGPGNPQSFAHITSSHQQYPISDYGKSKLYAEEFIRACNLFPYLIINPTAVYGPRDKDFLQFIQLVNKGIEPYIGFGKQMVSVVYVKDLASVIIQSTSSIIINRSYIVSDRMDYNKEQIGYAVKSVLHKKTFKIKIPSSFLSGILSVVEKIYQFFGAGIPFLNKQKVKEIRSANWLCDSKEIWNDNNVSPDYVLEKGMNEAIAWYKANKWL